MHSLVGNPIDTHDGNQTFDTIDLTIPTPSGDIYFSRSYSTFNAYWNSRASTDFYFPHGSMGPGWQHNYDTRLLFCEVHFSAFCTQATDLVIISPAWQLAFFHRPARLLLFELELLDGFAQGYD